MDIARKAFAAVSVLLLAGCASELPYPAPLGSEVIVNPTGIEVNSTDLVVTLDIVVWDPEEELALNNVLVTVKSAYPGIILIPETAILSLSNEDTDWQVPASEWYYELTNVADDDVQPDLVELATDYRGVARVYAYIKCLPMKCGSSIYDSCYVEAQLAEDPDNDTFASCQYSKANIYVSTGYSSESVEISAGK